MTVKRLLAVVIAISVYFLDMKRHGAMDGAITIIHSILVN